MSRCVFVCPGWLWQILCLPVLHLHLVLLGHNSLLASTHRPPLQSVSPSSLLGRSASDSEPLWEQDVKKKIHPSAHQHGYELNFGSGFFELLSMAAKNTCTGFSSAIPLFFFFKKKGGGSYFMKCKNWWRKMRKWTLGVILQNLSKCVCVFAEFCKWQMRLFTSKPWNVHPTSVLLWKRGRRDRERRVKIRAEHTGEYWPGNLFILRAKSVFLFCNKRKSRKLAN